MEDIIEYNKEEGAIICKPMQYKSLYEKVEAIKASIKMIAKDKIGRTGVGGSTTYKYVSISKLHSILNPLKHKYRLSFTIDIAINTELSISMKQPWYKARLRIIDLDTGYYEDRFYDFPMDIVEKTSAIKSFGSTLTYITRYIYQMFFEIVLSDDDVDAEYDDNINWACYKLVPAMIERLKDDKEFNIAKLSKTLNSLLTGDISREKLEFIYKEYINNLKGD